MPHLSITFQPNSLDYTWIDQNRKQVKLPAPQYIDYVMTWVGGLLSDEATFPTKAGEYHSMFLPLESLFLSIFFQSSYFPFPESDFHFDFSLLSQHENSLQLFPSQPNTFTSNYCESSLISIMHNSTI